MKRVDLRLPDPLYNIIQEEAEKTMSNQSVVIRQLIMDGLNARNVGIEIPVRESIRSESPSILINRRESVGRLKDAGIDIIEVTKAKRAKLHGREYNKDLEQFFDQI